MFGDDDRGDVTVADDWRPDSTLAVGLVPVAFSFARRRVRLLDLAGADCRERSFRHTVARRVADHPHVTAIESTWSTFIPAARQVPLPMPSGFIFNVARCGSTLLANMLAAPPGHVMLKESSTVGMLLNRLLIATNEPERHELEELLTATVPLFGGLAGRSQDRLAPRLFVKPHSLSTAAADLLLRRFPSTPAVFLYRDPNEVVASMLAAAPYEGLHDRPSGEIGELFPVLAALPPDLSPAAFYAHLWRSPVEAALELPPDRLLLIDYAELVGPPEAIIGRLARHFGLEESPEIVARMSGVTGFYSKDESGQVPFDATGAHYRPPPGARQRADVAGVVGALYDRLCDRRCAQR